MLLEVFSSPYAVRQILRDISALVRKYATLVSGIQQIDFELDMGPNLAKVHSIEIAWREGSTYFKQDLELYLL